MVYREYKVSLRRLGACLVYLPQTGSSLLCRLLPWQNRCRYAPANVRAPPCFQNTSRAF